ncbi:hypothetical protein CDAR_244611 [Caerostris darwini]|uniref:Uncharacterized protein n=1 Tax=Caerostris darwini TaxID=1538125 RepID=A0AAV4SG89_9ARAC|nr:hypothetical protein CDAR_244611 [Caerostris darwini]
MEIAKCEFCKAHVTNFEVHNCVEFGNQHRQSSTTLYQCSSATEPGDCCSIVCVANVRDAATCCVNGVLGINTVKVPQPFLDLVLVTGLKILIEEHSRLVMKNGAEL